MKKNSKRKIKDYSKFNCEQPEYYGLFVKNGRVRVDVKRMDKILRLNKNIVSEMNKHIKTVYFVPDKINRYDYMINIFRDNIYELKRQWREEIRPAMKNIKTPAQVKQETSTGYFMQTGILDYDECQMYGMWEALKREGEYEYLMRTIIAQFIHQFVSVIESVTLNVLTKKGYKSDSFSRNELDAFLQGYQKDCNNKTSNNISALQDLENYSNYDRMYNVWHFLKHNSKHLFNKINDKYPEMIYEKAEFNHGNLAMGVLKIDTSYVNSMFEDSIAFFSELCQKIFKENISDSQWNYDNYFHGLVNAQIKVIVNPLGIPYII